MSRDWTEVHQVGLSVRGGVLTEVPEEGKVKASPGVLVQTLNE